MRELTISELEIVSGGMALIVNTGKAVMNSPAGKASAANAAAGAAGYVGGNYLSGNESTWSGVGAAAITGGVLGPLKQAKPAGSLLWGGVFGYTEGLLNGRGPLRPEFLKNEQDKSGNNYGG